MSRENKFRAWDKEDEVMIYPEEYGNFYDLFFNLNAKDGLELYCIDMERNIDAEFMQYTGLKDKNYKDIYTGDIVKILSIFPIGDGSMSEKVKDKGVITFDKLGILAIKTGELNGKPCYSNFFHDIELCCDCEFEFEVIGNIYENLEFLEGESNERK